MNITGLIGPVLGIVASTSAGIAIDNAVKIVTPSNLSTMASFGVKIGTAIVGGVIGAKLANIIVENVKEITETVNSIEEAEDALQEED